MTHKGTVDLQRIERGKRLKRRKEKGVGHIIEPHPSLRGPQSNPNWEEKQKKWEKFIVEREWEYFLSK